MHLPYDVDNKLRQMHSKQNTCTILKIVLSTNAMLMRQEIIFLNPSSVNFIILSHLCSLLWVIN